MTKPRSNLTLALLETAGDMHDAGLMSDETYRQIVARHPEPDALPAAAPSSRASAQGNPAPRPAPFSAEL